MLSLETTIKIALPLSALVLAAINFRRAWRQRPKLDGPRCAHCLYNLTAMSSGECPECGTDPSVAGVIPAGRASLDHFRLPGWTALMALIAIGCFWLVHFNFAYLHRDDVLTMVNTGPAVGSCESRLSLGGEGWDRHVVIGSDDFEKRGLLLDDSTQIPLHSVHWQGIVSGESGTMDYDSRQDIWTLSQPGGAPRQMRGELSQAGVESCFPAGSIDPAVARTLHSALNEVAHTTNIGYVHSSHFQVEGTSYFQVTDRTEDHVLFQLASIDCLSWLLVGIWALRIPYLHIWLNGFITGQSALDYLHHYARAAPRPAGGA